MRLPEGVSAAEVERVFPDFIRKYYPDFLKEQVTHRLQPVRDIHLTSQLDYEMRRNGDRRSVDILALIGWAILVIAAVNFMNLATARSAHRAREVGVRKATGATRAADRPLPGGKHPGGPACRCRALLADPPGHAGVPRIGGGAGGPFAGADPADRARIGGLVGLLSGIYPAFFLSRFRPAVVLKANAPGSTRGQSLRKVLVVGRSSPSPWCRSWARCSCSASTSTCCGPIRASSRNRWKPIPVRAHAPGVQRPAAGAQELERGALGLLGQRRDRPQAQHARVQLGRHAGREWTYVPSPIVDEDFRSTVDLQIPTALVFPGAPR
ncbi:MAG: hypothetical protein R2810_15975 [Flavobacteriales bacterium]